MRDRVVGRAEGRTACALTKLPVLRFWMAILIVKSLLAETFPPLAGNVNLLAGILVVARMTPTCEGRLQ